LIHPTREPFQLLLIHLTALRRKSIKTEEAQMGCICLNTNLQELIPPCCFTWLIYSRSSYLCSFSTNSMLECSKKMNIISSEAFSRTSISCSLQSSPSLFKWEWLKLVEKSQRLTHSTWNRTESVLWLVLVNSFGVFSLNSYHLVGSNSNACNSMRSQWLQRKNQNLLKANLKQVLLDMLALSLRERRFRSSSSKVSRMHTKKVNGEI